MYIKTYLNKESGRIVAELSTDFEIVENYLYRKKMYIEKYLENESDYVDEEDFLDADERNRFNNFVNYFLSDEDENDILYRIVNSLKDKEILELIENDYDYRTGSTRPIYKEIIDEAIIKWMSDKFGIDYDLINWVFYGPDC